MRNLDKKLKRFSLKEREEVEREFGDKVRFLVSFCTNDQSQHYIAADALDMNMFIFDSWHDDELNQHSPQV